MTQKSDDSARQTSRRIFMIAGAAAAVALAFKFRNGNR